MDLASLFGQNTVNPVPVEQVQVTKPNLLPSLDPQADAFAAGNSLGAQQLAAGAGANPRTNPFGFLNNVISGKRQLETEQKNQQAQQARTDAKAAEQKKAAYDLAISQGYSPKQATALSSATPTIQAGVINRDLQDRARKNAKKTKAEDRQYNDNKIRNENESLAAIYGNTAVNEAINNGDVAGVVNAIAALKKTPGLALDKVGLSSAQSVAMKNAMKVRDAKKELALQRANANEISKDQAAFDQGLLTKQARRTYLPKRVMALVDEKIASAINFPIRKEARAELSDAVVNESLDMDINNSRELEAAIPEIVDRLKQTGKYFEAYVIGDEGQSQMVPVVGKVAVSKMREIFGKIDSLDAVNDQDKQALKTLAVSYQGDLNELIQFGKELNPLVNSSEQGPLDYFKKTALDRLSRWQQTKSYLSNLYLNSQ